MSCWCCGKPVEAPEGTEYPTCAICEASLVELCQPAAQLKDYDVPRKGKLEPDSLRLIVADLMADEVRRQIYSQTHVDGGLIYVDPKIAHLGPVIQRIARYVRRVNGVS